MFDFEKEKWYQPLKTGVIVSFISISILHFVTLQGGSDHIDINTLPTVTENFGFVVGLLSFSYS